MSEAIIAQGVKKSYRMGENRVEVLRGVDLTINEGEWVAILGASGSGKTTLLNILGGLERLDSGTVKVFGDDISKYSKSMMDKYRRQKVGMIFQAYHLISEINAQENVVLPSLIAGMNFSSSLKRAKSLLEELGLRDRIFHKPLQLSGGEQQRVAIARALMNAPQILFADEPTGNLDSETGSELLKMLKRIRENGAIKTIVMVTHDREVAQIADRVIHLKDGKVVL